jgi:hypothetical protein
MKGSRMRQRIAHVPRRLVRRRAAGPRPAPTSIWRWPTAPPTTAWCAAAAASASAAAPGAPTTSASRRPCRPSPASRRRSRRCAWRPSAWRRAPRSSCPRKSSGWWSASRRVPLLRLELPARTTRPARWSIRTTPSSSSSRRSRPTCRPTPGHAGDLGAGLALAARHRGRHPRAVVRTPSDGDGPLEARVLGAGEPRGRRWLATARYIIGIDLGTTNTAVAYVDTKSADQRSRCSRCRSWSPRARSAAPPAAVVRVPARRARSFAGRDRPALGCRTPARGRRAGPRARARACQPHDLVGQVVAVSRRRRSQRGHPALGRRGRHRQDVAGRPPRRMVLRTSRKPGTRPTPARRTRDFVDQEVIVTVPASFDEAARELTLEAAERAGLESVVLLEEPQAAFYAWIESHPATARSALAPAIRILVFDVGGGTTDFTLIAVGDDGDSFERTAVGDHLLLGGDNIDLTLAKQVEKRLRRPGQAKKLDTLQWHGLVHACRLAKETLLSGDDRRSRADDGRRPRLQAHRRQSQGRDHPRPSSTPSTAASFPVVEAGDQPRRARGGLQELGGLPYAADPAVTRHLASFLGRHGATRVDAVLFNGGAMTPASLRRRVLEQLAALAARGRRPARAHQRPAGAGRRQGRGLLRPGPPRPRRAHPRRHRARLLRRRRRQGAGEETWRCAWRPRASRRARRSSSSATSSWSPTARCRSSCTRPPPARISPAPWCRSATASPT